MEAFQKLGYQAVSEITHDTMRLVDICFMQLDGYTIELVSPYDSDSVVYSMVKKYRNMPYHICYEWMNLVRHQQEGEGKCAF